VTDGDLLPSDSHPNLEGEDTLPQPPNLQLLEGSFVKVFACKTTFERSLTFEQTLEIFARSSHDIGAPIVAQRLRAGAQQLAQMSQPMRKAQVLNSMRDLVLSTAKRFGKARFAQMTARHVECAGTLSRRFRDLAYGPMKLTNEQAAAVRCEDNLMLTACPGSGKTRVIISKLVRTIESVRETTRAVGCITYTNAAVHEIESRLRLHIQPDDDRYYDVGTIHSFCPNYIFRPFCHLIDGYKKGFKVLTPDNPESSDMQLQLVPDLVESTSSIKTLKNLRSCE
jgi:hypothetical protein